MDDWMVVRRRGRSQTPANLQSACAGQKIKERGESSVNAVLPSAAKPTVHTTASKSKRRNREQTVSERARFLCGKVSEAQLELRESAFYRAVLGCLEGAQAYSQRKYQTAMKIKVCSTCSPAALQAAEGAERLHAQRRSAPDSGCAASTAQLPCLIDRPHSGRTAAAAAGTAASGTQHCCSPLAAERMPADSAAAPAPASRREVTDGPGDMSGAAAAALAALDIPPVLPPAPSPNSAPSQPSDEAPPPARPAPPSSPAGEEDQVCPGGWRWDTVKAMVVYGLGSLESGPVPRYQLALALLLAERLPALRGPVEVFDPVFTELDRVVLAEVGLRVMDEDEQGRRVACAPTLFYLPHCEAELCDNLIAANAAARALGHMAVLGNSFRLYAERWVPGAGSVQQAHRRKRPDWVLAAAAAATENPSSCTAEAQHAASALGHCGAARTANPCCHKAPQLAEPGGGRQHDACGVHGVVPVARPQREDGRERAGPEVVEVDITAEFRGLPAAFNDMGMHLFPCWAPSVDAAGLPC